MNTSITVQPVKGWQRKGNSIQANKHIVRLIECGGDADAATQLIHRITDGKLQPADKYEAAAIQSFVDLVATLSSSGGRLTSVS